MPPVAYPKRPAFFAHQFTRLLAKVCLANELGADVCWLLTVVSHTEDAKGYRDAVTFFNGQLIPLLGCGSEDSLARLRKRAVRAGWMHYEAGGKGVAGRYWVMIPDQFLGVDDAPTDERSGKYVVATTRTGAGTTAGDSAGTTAGRSAGRSRGQVRGQPREKCGEKPGTSADHSSLSLSQESLSPDSLSPIPAADKPPRPRNELFDAIAEVTGTDSKASGGFVAKVAAALRKADPPYTAAEVRQLGAMVAAGETCGWAVDKGRTRPTLGEVEKYIGHVRNSQPASRAAPKANGYQTHDDRVLGVMFPPTAEETLP